MKTDEIKDFCEEHGLTIDQFYGKEEIEGDLDLYSITEIPEGFNPTVGYSLDLHSLTKLPKGFNPTVGGFLDLSSVTKISKDFNPTVGGSLYLSSVKELPEGFNPIVGSSLDLSSIKELPKGFSPTVGGFLDLSSVTKISKDFSPTVGGSLYLRSVTELSEKFNIKVGGNLDLRSVIELPKDFNITVGNNLYLDSIDELPNEFNSKVGEAIYYNKIHKNINHDLPILSWQNGKYIKVDYIFCEVIHEKGNIFKCKLLNKEKYFYVVTDGNNTYAHGDTIKEAQSDLLYKLSERNVDDYKNLTLDSILTHDEAVICYRVITGACSFGTNDFLENILGDNSKEFYTINEIIQLTENQYGNITFKDFFND